MPKLIKKESFVVGTINRYEPMTLDEYIALVDEHHPNAKIEFNKRDLCGDEFVELMVNGEYAGKWFSTGNCYIWEDSSPDQ